MSEPRMMVLLPNIDVARDVISLVDNEYRQRGQSRWGVLAYSLSGKTLTWLAEADFRPIVLGPDAGKVPVPKPPDDVWDIIWDSMPPGQRNRVELRPVDPAWYPANDG